MWLGELRQGLNIAKVKCFGRISETPSKTTIDRRNVLLTLSNFLQSNQIPLNYQTWNIEPRMEQLIFIVSQ